MSGDEFTAVVEDVATSVAAVDIAGRVIGELGSDYQVGEALIHATVSIGMSLSASGAADPQDLLHQADIALYRAKAAGKSRWALFGEDVDSKLAQQ
jgi:diguanylate cyclase (GGDEF)-like protein